VKQRLDQALTQRGITVSRSQAESWVKLGKVTVNGKPAAKPGQMVLESDLLKLTATEQYVSRAGLKLASVAQTLKLDFKNKVVLDVGSSTGGFTDYALQHGATKVIAVDVGSNQLHPSLHGHPQIELHEQTDIRNLGQLEDRPQLALIDVSFISIVQVLPSIAALCALNSQIVAMVKPQFETSDHYKHKGVIKNDNMRRQILKDFEQAIYTNFVTIDKADSQVAGAKGNRERFYLLQATG